MKRVIFILLCVMFADAVYAQLSKSQEGYIEKKVAEAEAKAKKEKEAKELKEREERIKTERRHEEQSRQHETTYNRQMENLNKVKAEDFLNNPQHQEGSFSSKVKKFREGQQTTNVVATPKKEGANQSGGNPFGNSGRIGSPSYSGLNYTGNRYDINRAGYENTKQQPQSRVPAYQIRGQYKPNRNMRQGVVNLQRTNVMSKPKVQVPPQHNNIAQRPQQQRDAHSARSVQTQQKQQPPVQQQKTRFNENGKLIIDPSKGSISVTLQQNNSSTDLAKVDTRKIDYATKYNNITVYNVSDDSSRPLKATSSPAIKSEASYLSDGDNKRPSGSLKGLAHDERTQEQQAQLMREDMMNGFSSFDNRKKWEYIYDYGYVRTVKTSAHQVTKRR